MTPKVKLETASELINAAGGTTRVAERFGVTVEAVCAWRRNGLPAKRYIQWQAVLSELNAEAPASLWGQKIGA